MCLAGELLNERTIAFIFNDVKEDFRSLRSVLLNFLKWRHCSPGTYIDTYASMSLPEILAPFVRLELLPWLPLRKPKTFDEFPFFMQLFSFHEVGCGSSCSPHHKSPRALTSPS
mgnify:FL=1